MQTTENMQFHAFRGIRRAHQVVRFQFILTELDLAITFCDIALSTVDPEKVERNLENAKQAYGSAVYFLDSASLGIPMTREVHDRIQRLKVMLRQLGVLRRREFLCGEGGDRTLTR
jgi:hypothetical protein